MSLLPSDFVDEENPAEISSASSPPMITSLPKGFDQNR